jgi:hypothetical protein
METMKSPEKSFSNSGKNSQKKKRLAFEFKVGDTRIEERYSDGNITAYSKKVDEYVELPVEKRILLGVGHSTTFNQVFTDENMGFVEYLHTIVNKFAEGKKRVSIEEVAEEFQKTIDAGYVEQIDENKFILTEESLPILQPQTS